MAPIIGIDLGTSNSLCAVFEEGQPKLIPNAHGSYLTPSIVSISEDDRVLVGAAAKECRITQPERCAWVFKRLMGTERKVEIEGQTFSPVEMSSLVLKSLKEDAETYLGQEVSDAIITVPAYFNDHQRNATKQAGELAGLKVRRIINEPTAAALTYGFHDRGAEKKLIVIDLGGGTFDVTAMDIFEGTLEIISTAGESMLGGEDFNDRLLSWALSSQNLQLEQTEVKQPLLFSRLRQECEAAKCALSSETEATIRIPNQQGEIDQNSITLTITRDKFKELVDPLLKRLARPIARAVRDSRIPPEEFTDVILVGGATRMDIVQSFVRTFFGVEPKCSFNPDEVVALGAAVQAALIQDDRAVEDMVMTDICPFTLGTEISKDFGSRHADGYYLPIIHRNTTIPVSREEVVCTAHPNQRHVTVNVYQGEARKVEDNLFLGKLEIKGLPPGPAGKHVHLRFTYDMNGILEVEAYLPETGKKYSLVLTQHANLSSDKEIKSAVQKLQKLKFYPRDDVKNQHLVRYAERVIGEVSPFQREELEAAIDFFEQSMASGEREWFESARESLLFALSALNFDYREDLEN
ncbi:molecular chaperone HscC [uncultured Gimesia sp.]|uniref:Hsp70 family protein n=1 Tax=uncultured Gimesia sp. TaxID=1678688 RepID=UPI0030DB7A09|tara:strand:- start:49253 stop:50989 length:1737 start_codon:yes stop_codon:yes gene_type:complete